MLACGMWLIKLWKYVFPPPKKKISPQFSKGPLEKEAKEKVGLPVLFTSAKHYFLLITASHCLSHYVFSINFQISLYFTQPHLAGSIYIYKVEFFVIKLLFIFLSENKGLQAAFQKRNIFSYNWDCMGFTGQLNNFKNIALDKGGI